MSASVPQSATVTLTFLSYWQCGTGTGGGDLDELVARDAAGLPFVSGKRLKGVLREAYECLEHWDLWKLGDDRAVNTPVSTNLLFGLPGGADGSGVLTFDSAHLVPSDAAQAKEQKQEARLFSGLRSTAIESAGAAKSQSLRNEEAAIPLVLTCQVRVLAEKSHLCPRDWVERLARAGQLVRELGKRKTRGRGRVALGVTEDVAPAPIASVGPATNKATTPSQASSSFHLVWKTNGPLVLSAHAATLGAHECLSFLPGYMIAGLLASTMYKALGSDLACKVFSRGHVRFGDGHVVHGHVRTRPVPATWVSQGGKYPNSWIPSGAQTDTQASAVVDIAMLEGGASNPRVCVQRTYRAPREERTDADLVLPPKGRSMHTALKQGVSASGKLFSYEYIQPGTVFSGDLVIALSDDEELSKVVQALTDALLPDRAYRLGRSRSTEYGELQLLQFSPNPSNTSNDVNAAAPSWEAGKVFSLLCESHLQVFDGHGMPTVWPTCSSWLGLPKGELIADRSSVSCATVARFNGFYNCAETDRLVIERGSVLTYKLTQGWTAADRSQRLSLGVGEGLAEGFGEVSVMPDMQFQKVNCEAALVARGNQEAAHQSVQTVIGKWLQWRGSDLPSAARSIAEALFDAWEKQLDVAGKFGALGPINTWAPGSSQWGKLRTEAQRWCQPSVAERGVSTAAFGEAVKVAMGQGDDNPWRNAVGIDVLVDSVLVTPTLGTWLLAEIGTRASAISAAPIFQPMVLDQLAQLAQRAGKEGKYAR